MTESEAAAVVQAVQRAFVLGQTYWRSADSRRRGVAPGLVEILRPLVPPSLWCSVGDAPQIMCRCSSCTDQPKENRDA